MKLDMLKGAAIGAAIAYLFDPHNGRARRAAVASAVAGVTRSLLGRPGRPLRWEAPMMTIQIDVDDRQAWDREQDPDRRHPHGPGMWPQISRRSTASHPGHQST
jgi:hypothetical protein